MLFFLGIFCGYFEDILWIFSGDSVVYDCEWDHFLRATKIILSNESLIKKTTKKKKFKDNARLITSA